MNIPAGKSAKMPNLHTGTKLLSFDLEANGLHGQAFAVGAVLMGSTGKVYSEFTARCRPTDPIDPWVKANILPAIATMQVTHDSFESMRDAFWEWFVATEQDCDYVLVSNGYPVEYRFLAQCQDADIQQRYWQHPYPILDLTSLMLQMSNKIAKNKLAQQVQKSGAFQRHHPLDDAKVSALLAFEAFRYSGQIG